MTSRYSKPKVKVYKMPDLQDNFGLTKIEFEKFVQNVKDGDESLFLIIFNRHFNASVIYIMNMFSISEDKAYDVCMDTLIEFRSKLVRGKIKYGNLRYLYTRMAVNNFIDQSKKDKKIKSAINVFLSGNEEHELGQEEFFDLLQKVVDNLEDEHKKLIHELYFSGKDQNQVAEDNQISYAALRKRKQRIMKTLRGVFFTHLKK